MIWLLLIPLVCAVFAYVPLALIVLHSRTPKKLQDDLLKRYVEEDAISTSEYLDEVDRQWEDIDHVPLR